MRQDELGGGDGKGNGDGDGNGNGNWNGIMIENNIQNMNQKTSALKKYE